MRRGPFTLGEEMETLGWSRRLETGIDTIDAQHRSLFDAVNRLAAAFDAGDATSTVREALAFLAAYTLDHFEAEERLMEEVGFPGLAEHRDEHARLLIRVRVLQGRLDQDIPVSREVAALFTGWLRHHICERDMAYVQFMKDHPRSA